jgi:hypothetical protein
MRKVKCNPIIGILLTSLMFLWGQTPIHADSTSPHLAAYYDLKMLICGQTAYQWKGNGLPQLAAHNVVQVGVGRDASYALTKSGQLLTWQGSPKNKKVILDNITWFVAGRTGVFAARENDELLYIARSQRLFKEGEATKPIQISSSVLTASIGDSANYYVTKKGTLFVKGLAHRGQYGDGKLTSTEKYISVVNKVIAIKAHTGHAILLKQDGSVMGTGGNIFGPLGRHGVGDKAAKWGTLLTGAVAIATGSSHSLAIREGGSLWHWGRDISLDPQKVLDNVVAAAADQEGSIAFQEDNTLWQWERGQQPRKHFRCPDQKF